MVTERILTAAATASVNSVITSIKAPDSTVLQTSQVPATFPRPWGCHQICISNRPVPPMQSALPTSIMQGPTKTGSGDLLIIIRTILPTRRFSAKELRAQAPLPGQIIRADLRKRCHNRPQVQAPKTPLQLGARTPRIALQTGYSAVPNDGAESGNGES